MAGLDIAMLTGRSSLLMRQTQMSVTGNNIANASKTGYHRQSLAVSNAHPVDAYNARLGTGVQIESVMRTYDRALERNLRQTIQQDGYYQTYTNQLEQLEMTLAPDGKSPLASAMTEFSASWSEVDADPTSVDARRLLLEKGQGAADEIDRARSKLVQLRNNIDDGVGGTVWAAVSEANRLANGIANLNAEIQIAETRRFNPQEAVNLRDQRDKLAQQLSRLVDVDINEGNDGTWTLGIGGRDYVAGDQVNELAVGPLGAANLKWASDNANVDQDGGKTQALLDMRSYIQSSIDELDTFATTMADTLNEQHKKGYDLTGTAGADLFDASTPGDMQFLLSDATAVAAAGTAGAAGDSANARAMANQMSASIPALDEDSLLERPDRIVDSVAMDTASASSLADGTEAGIEMFEQAIGETSGVNLDEEMMDMLEAQRAYQASARFVNVVDEMLASVIQMV